LGTMKKTVYSKRYGVDLVRFTHHPQAVLVASKNGWDESIRYLSLYDHKFLRYFKGHKQKVVSLELHPQNDTFLSAALDNSVRLWDLRSNVCQGLIRVTGRPAVAYDPSGLIFAIACGSDIVKLFDDRNCDKGPFSTTKINPVNKNSLTSAPSASDWTFVKISPDGKYILLATTSSTLYLLDAFDGNLVRTFSNFSNKGKSVIEAGFTPDSLYVFSGSDDGSIHLWETETGNNVCSAWTGHTSPVSVVQFNPTKMLVASGDTAGNLALWVPNSIKTDGIAKADTDMKNDT